MVRAMHLYRENTSAFCCLVVSRRNVPAEAFDKDSPAFSLALPSSTRIELKMKTSGCIIAVYGSPLLIDHRGDLEMWLTAQHFNSKKVYCSLYLGVDWYGVKHSRV